MTQPRRPMPRQQRALAMSPRSQVLTRRRFALIGLGAAVLVTLLLALFTGSVAVLILNLIVDVILAGYIAMLLQIKQGQSSPQYRPQPPREDDEEIRVVPR